MFKLLILLVCLPFVLSLPFVALTYAFFWYETANGPHRSRLAELSGGRPVWWVLRGMLSGVVAVAIVIVSFPLGWARRPGRAREPAGGSRPPVVLIHGLYHNAGAWVLFRWRLGRAGYPCVETFQYSSWTHSFDELTRELSGVIDEVYSREGKSVVLIGHSLGGLLGKACAQDPANAGKIAALVTLGSPHQGSKLAALAVGELGGSLLFRGSLITRMEGRFVPESVLRLAVVSPVDNMVLPNEALQVRESGWDYHETAPISHVSMLYHAPTAKRVIQFLESL
jgi:triacylglycerol lipase